MSAARAKLGAGGGGSLANEAMGCRGTHAPSSYASLEDVIDTVNALEGLLMRLGALADPITVLEAWIGYGDRARGIGPQKKRRLGAHRRLTLP